jgi:hypothetical protein
MNDSIIYLRYILLALAMEIPGITYKLAAVQHLLIKLILAVARLWTSVV